MRTFTQNLAYVHEFGAVKDKLPQNGEYDFWVAANNNAIDIAVLEVCKLLAVPTDRHCWRQVLDPHKFEPVLLDGLGISHNQHETYLKTLRRYRDKFVAHLDNELVMDVPHLGLAESAVRIYHEGITSELGDNADIVLVNLPWSPQALRTVYQNQARAARSIFERAIALNAQ